MSDSQDALDLTMAAAALRSNSGDVHLLLNVLSRELAEALGERLEVHYQGGRLRKSKDVTSLEITLDNDHFAAQLEGTRLQCVIARLSGGIRIRSEAVEVDDWLLRLLEGLKREAQQSDAARRAFEHIIIGGST